jgi:hypothetical protein
MDKKEEFKRFVSKHPELVEYVKNKKNTWQDFYEIYDMYGENEEAWSKYQEVDRSLPLAELTNLVKNINMDNVQKYINNAQKAINVIQELTTKSTDKVVQNIPKSPRPITKFFGD